MRSISFIVCTIENSGREQRLKKVIDNLNRQDSINTEIIVIWQGKDPTNAPTFPGIQTVVADFFSSSQARNLGASKAKNDLLCFLDDDTYPVSSKFSRDVIEIIEARNLDFVTCNISSSGAIMAGEATDSDVVMDEKSIIPHMWEPGLSIRRVAFEKVCFDPTIGIGCIHGSSEGFDLGYRLLKAGFSGQRIAGLLIDHPPLNTVDDYRAERAFYYSLGNGAVLVQHGYYATYIWQITKTIARLIFSLVRGDRTRATSSFIRTLSMVVGPFIPRRHARIIPLTSIRSHDANKSPLS